MAENTPAIAAETPGIYKRFAQSDKISQGTTNAALSLNDYLPGQHVTGPNNNDIAATLAQVQAIPIGTATLSGNTYNVTISNYPNTATICPGQKISVQFKYDAPTADDTALNLSAFGKSLPMCARGIRMGRGSIKSGMVLNFIYWPDKWNANYDLVENVNGVLKYAESSSVYNKQSVDNLVTKVSYSALTFNADGGSAIQQTLLSAKGEKFGDIYKLTAEIQLPEITETRLAYIKQNFLPAGCRVYGKLIDNYSYQVYDIVSIQNSNGWIVLNGERIRENVFSNRHIFLILQYIPYTSASPQLLALDN